MIEKLKDPYKLHIRNQQHITIGRRNFDFKIDKCKILLEVNGDFWHANPKKYSAEDIVPFPDGKVKASVIWVNDNRKRLTAESNGYKLLVIWESELTQMSDKDLDMWIIKNVTL